MSEEHDNECACENCEERVLILTQGVDSLVERVNSLAEVVSSLERRVSSIDNSFSSFSSSINSLSEEVVDLSSSISQARSNAESVDEVITRNKGDLDEKTQQLGSALDDLSERTYSVGTLSRDIGSSISSELEQRISSLMNSVLTELQLVNSRVATSYSEWISAASTQAGKDLALNNTVAALDIYINQLQNMQEKLLLELKEFKPEVNLEGLKIVQKDGSVLNSVVGAAAGAAIARMIEGKADGRRKF